MPVGWEVLVPAVLTLGVVAGAWLHRRRRGGAAMPPPSRARAATIRSTALPATEQSTTVLLAAHATASWSPYAEPMGPVSDWPYDLDRPDVAPVGHPRLRPHELD